MAEDSLDDVRRRAALARRLAGESTDETMSKRLLEKAVDLERRAAELQKSVKAAATHAEIAKQNAAEMRQTSLRMLERARKLRKPRTEP